MKKYNCIFKDYGDVERICIKCGYVIPKTDNDELCLDNMINFNNIATIPDCIMKNIVNYMRRCH